MLLLLSRVDNGDYLLLLLLLLLFLRFHYFGRLWLLLTTMPWGYETIFNVNHRQQSGGSYSSWEAISVHGVVLLLLFTRDGSSVTPRDHHWIHYTRVSFLLLCKVFMNASCPINVVVLSGYLSLPSVTSHVRQFWRSKVRVVLADAVRTLISKWERESFSYLLSTTCYSQVLSVDGTQEVGKISKQWSGLVKEYFTDADNFGIQCKTT